MNFIHVVAGLITDPDGRMLVVRKRGTTMFMNPGGKPEPGESAVQTLCRELAEEIGLDVPLDEPEFVDTFTVAAANEPGFDIRAEVFRLKIDSADHQIGAEIVESRWVDPARPGDVPLAPLAIEHLVPLLTMSDPSGMGNSLQ